MTYLIDANIFLEAQLEQGKSEVCREFLGKVRDGNVEAVLTMFHADTIAIMMENKGFGDKISGFLLSLYMYEGLDVLNMELSSKAEAAMSDNSLGFDDSIAFQALNEVEAEKIVTYDDDFDEKVRITPEKVLDNTR